MGPTTTNTTATTATATISGVTTGSTTVNGTAFNYTPYTTLDHITIHASDFNFTPCETHNSMDEVCEIKAILFDVCCLLADLYEKKRLGRNGDLSAIRAFIDSIKVTEG